MMTFEQMCKIEPGLRLLLEEAQSADRLPGHECANKLWYGRGGLKERMSELAGWNARNPELRDDKLYDMAYKAIYFDSLPDCDECSRHNNEEEINED